MVKNKDVNMGIVWDLYIKSLNIPLVSTIQQHIYHIPCNHQQLVTVIRASSLLLVSVLATVHVQERDQ